MGIAEESYQRYRKRVEAADRVEAFLTSRDKMPHLDRTLIGSVMAKGDEEPRELTPEDLRILIDCVRNKA